MSSSLTAMVAIAAENTCSRSSRGLAGREFSNIGTAALKQHQQSVDAIIIKFTWLVEVGDQ